MQLDVEKIKYLTIVNNMKYVEVAKKTGITKEHLSTLLNKKSNPTLKTITALASSLGVEYREIIKD